MWWKFIVFCLLVCAVLFVVLSSITGAPAAMLFHRCCEEGIENDDVALESFRHNFLRERLIMEKVERVEKFGDVENSTRMGYASSDSALNGVGISDTTHASSQERLANEEAVTASTAKNLKRVSDLNNTHINKDSHEENNNDAVTEDSKEIRFSDDVRTKQDSDDEEKVESTVEARTFSVHDVKMRELVVTQSGSEKNVVERSRSDKSITSRTAIL